MNKKTYYIMTIGCQMNKADSEKIAGYLENLNYKKIKDSSKTEINILTTCGVRQSAEDRVYGLVNKIKKQNPKTILILTGCLALRKDVQKRLKNKVDIWLSIGDLINLDKILLNFKNKKEQENKKNYNNCNYLNLKPKYDSKFSAFIPIGNGCNNFCSYCVVPYARGREKYRSVNEIKKEVEYLIKNNYKEITLIAQNVNSFQDNQYNFADLLKIINDLPGKFWLRFSTSHPKDVSDKLIKTIANNEKIVPHFHLPVQAGDNKILQAMNRNYTIEHYQELIKKVKKNIADISLTTDIIVGFPNETNNQFQNTVKLFKKVKFDMAYISQYSPRFGTKAFELKDNISKEEKGKRENELIEIFKKTALENNQKYLNKKIEVLIINKKIEQEFIARIDTNKIVKIKTKEDLKVGEFYFIKINQVKSLGLGGIL